MHYVYLLRSEKDLGFYIGRSNDLKARIKEHSAGNVSSTKNRQPLKLVYYESYDDEKLAIERELKLKQFGSSYSGLLKRLGLKL